MWIYHPTKLKQKMKHEEEFKIFSLALNIQKRFAALKNKYLVSSAVSYKI